MFIHEMHVTVNPNGSVVVERGTRNRLGYFDVACRTVYDAFPLAKIGAYAGARVFIHSSR